LQTTIALFCLAAASAAGPSEPPAGLSPELVKKAADRWGKHLVPVNFWLQRSEGEKPSLFPGIRAFTARALRAGGSVEGQYDEKRPVEVAGLAVDPHTIWLPDLGFEKRFIAKVEAGDPPAPAALWGAFVRAPGWVVRTEGPLPGIEPVKFSKGDRSIEGLLALSSSFEHGGWVRSVSGAGGEYRRQGGSLWLEAGRGALLLDRSLEPVGFSLSGRLGLESAPDIWRGAEISASPVLELPAFDRSTGELFRQAAPWLLTVRGFFRHEEEAEGHGGRRFRYRYRGDEEGRRNDFLATGYAVGRKQVLVNFSLNREAALRLERLLVSVGGQERPARFTGAFRHFHAFLVELEGEPLTEPLDLSARVEFAIFEPLIALTADHETGHRRDLASLNRIADFERGYRGVIEPVLQRFPRPGTLFLGVEDRKLLGAIVEVNRESDEEEPHRSFRSRGGVDLRLLTPGELGKLVKAGPEAFDPRLLPKGAEHEKDMVWLGVEFQPISRELAKSQGVEIATRGGEIGLIVLNVLAGSPAARAGLAPGDILLSVRPDDETEPWELRAGGEAGREEAFEEASDDDSEDASLAMSFGGGGPPWRSPRNSLNEKLTRIGEGRKVELVYLRGMKEERVSVSLEVAPADFENARKYKSEELGLTLKDLTYEVRSHYRLKDDAPGVVVAKVEPGGKAAIAKVLPFEILVSVNGKQVRDVEQLRAVLEEVARMPGGDKTLELKLERMGKSRLVRIRS
jgi:hypothetical protein